MEHSVHGIRVGVPPNQVEPLRNQGWRLCLGNNDFAELVHLQSWYFQVRALFAYHASNSHPEAITTSDINSFIASAAFEWIAGPTEAVVRDALLMRVYH